MLNCEAHAATEQLPQTLSDPQKLKYLLSGHLRKRLQTSEINPVLARYYCLSSVKRETSKGLRGIN